MNYIKNILNSNPEYIDTLCSMLTGSFGILLNANDFFNYATAECVTIDSLDLHWILPIYKQFGEDGLNACMSYIDGRKPIIQWQNDKFNLAYKELERIKPKVESSN